MRTMCRVAVIAVLGAAWSVAAGNVTILNSHRTTMLNIYDSVTAHTQTQELSTDGAVGVWTAMVGSFGGGYARQHSVIDDSFVFASMSAHSETYYPEGDFGHSIQESGSSLLFTRFEISGDTTGVLMDNGLLFAALIREVPDPNSWEFPVMQRTELTGLIPGVYVFRARSVPDAAGSGTLYIPGPGSYLLLAFGLVPLLARPGRAPAQAS